MTRILIKVMFITALIFAGGCSDKGDGPDVPGQTGKGTINVNSESLTFEKEGGTQAISVSADIDWGVRTDSDWITVTPSGGLKGQTVDVKVTVKSSTADETRKGIVTIYSGSIKKEVSVTQRPASVLKASSTSLSMGAQASTVNVKINANESWTATCDASWITITPASGNAGETEMAIAAAANDSKADREAKVTLKSEGASAEIKIMQLSDEIVTPAGYTLVWNDEFDKGTTLGSDWTHEVQGPGWVNNELQSYVNGQVNGKRVTELKDGILHINCFKDGGKIYSGRVYAKVGTGWTYGYFEARINLPKGKGTWPAFWMMPVGNDWGTNPWPKCGEIDIMEEVGVVPNEVSSSIHTQKYNHTKNTQKTHAMRIADAEGGWHTYALEWTEDAITTYVDGKVQLAVKKSVLGTDHDSWPFHYAFYPILNLAWGGSWGGMQGVDESALPVTMKVDYVRVFQKK